MHAGAYSTWTDGATTHATSYLWIPERCRRLRGLLILCQNVPEHRLVGHPAIRDVCARNDLGIVWSTPSFWYSKGQKEYGHIVDFLQRQLDGLAAVSGYDEVATVPWLPMGESGHLLMVDALVEAVPERCMAGIWIKNAHLPPHNRTTPALIVYGTGQEWGQDKADFSHVWNDLKAYDGVLKEKMANPDWPLSFVVDGKSGHFDVSERLVNYFAHYIGLVAKARLSTDGSSRLKAVDLQHGYLADLPVPGHERHPVVSYAKAMPEGRGAAWFFDRWSAREAQAFATINWNAESQLPAFADAHGRVAPFDFNGIESLTPEMEADGITFHLRGVLLDKLPENFAGAGQPLAKAPGNPAIEWLCGPIAPWGDGRFRIALDRTWPQHPVYLAVRHPGDSRTRAVVQPISIKLQRNSEGRKQTIAFEAIQDVQEGAGPIRLMAKSDAGLPVDFYVVAGPAIVRDGRLIFTAIPPRTKVPVSVTVGAWQWGRDTEPKIKTADVVTQTFRIFNRGAK
jgi:hypothetical protein